MANQTSVNDEAVTCEKGMQKHEDFDKSEISKEDEKLLEKYYNKLTTKCVEMCKKPSPTEICKQPSPTEMCIKPSPNETVGELFLLL